MKHLEQRGELVIQTYANAGSSFVKEKSADGQSREGRMQRWECPGEDGLVGDIHLCKIDFFSQVWKFRLRERVCLWGHTAYAEAQV